MAASDGETDDSIPEFGDDDPSEHSNGGTDSAEDDISGPNVSSTSGLPEANKGNTHGATPRYGGRPVTIVNVKHVWQGL